MNFNSKSTKLNMFKTLSSDTQTVESIKSSVKSVKRMLIGKPYCVKSYKENYIKTIIL